MTDKLSPYSHRQFKLVFLSAIAVTAILSICYCFTLTITPTAIRYAPPSEVAADASNSRLLQAVDHTYSDSLDERIGQALTTRLQCRRPQYRRYEGLKGQKTFIALNLHNSQDVLPTLLHALLETIRFIGPEHVFLSIYEGGSGDKTAPVIRAAVDFLESLGLWGVDVNTDTVSEDFDKMNRIKVLADYRNLAIKSLYTLEPRPSAVLFINDIFVCSYQMLELLHQHHSQSADMTCGFDWETNGIFYDSWVARDITGHLFNDIPEQGFTYSDNMFPHSPADRARYNRGEPFQVYSCWNGMISLNPTPFLEIGVVFRRSRQNECAASEATLLAKDYWTHNFSRVMVVPSINVAYTLDAAHDQQEKKVSKTLWNGVVRFTRHPPPAVACRPWPEENGIFANPWPTTEWVPPVDDLVELEKHKGEPDNIGADGNYPTKERRFEKRGSVRIPYSPRRRTRKGW